MGEYGPLKVWLFFKGREIEENLWKVPNFIRAFDLCRSYDIAIGSGGVIDIDYTKSEGLKDVGVEVINRELLILSGIDHKTINVIVRRWLSRSKGEEKAFILLNF